MARYADTTEVPVEKSRAEIERLLQRYGANRFASGWQDDSAAIGFEMLGRRLRFILPLPDRGAKEFTHRPVNQHGGDRPRSPVEQSKMYERRTRQRWRALALVIKAKLEAVDSGIVTFEDEFLAQTVMPSGKTVAEETRESVALAYRSGVSTPLLPNYSN